MSGWRNWSGSVSSTGRVVSPGSLDELAAVLRAARRVRAVGAGHSFMPLCASDELILSIADLPGNLVVAPDRRSARVPAGWSISRLSAALHDEGLALANQGDVDAQSLAGAMATGTHGTGADLGSLSTLTRGFRTMNANGESRWCDATCDPDLFQAQRLSLGMFGMVTEIDVEVVPAYHLAERVTTMRWADVRACFDDLAASHRHVEFFLFPHADSVILKTLSPTEPCDLSSPGADDEALFRRLLDLGARLPVLVPWLQKAMMRSSFAHTRRGPAHAIFPSPRTIRFEEMEYEVPRAAGLALLDELIGWIRRKRLPVSFPFEFRLVAADDIWLSPMHNGPVAAVSMHQYARMPWSRLFADAERICRAHGGRPHWGKRHSLTAADVDRLYPMAERFRAVRRAADPEGKFLNPHLEAIFQ